MIRVVFLVCLLLGSLFSKELQKVSIQLPWFDQFQFAGYYIAKEKGFYKKAGLDVEIKGFKKGLFIIDEVVKGRADFSIGRSELIIHKSRGKDIKLVSAILQSSPLVLLSLKNNGIDSVKDIAGKTIMGGKNPVSFAPINAMLNKSGVDTKTIDLKKHTYNLDPLVKKEVDLLTAYLSNETYKLNEMGIEYNIFDPKEYGFDFYSDILFTSSDLIKNNQHLVHSFANATLKGWEYAFNNIEESIDLLLKKYNSQNKTKEAFFYEANELKKLAFYETPALGHIDFHKLQRIYDIYNLMGLIKNEINIEDMVYHNSCFCDLALSLEEIEYIRSNPVLKVHNESNWPPFNYNEKGIPKGFSIEYMELLAKKGGFKLEYISGYTWSQYMDMIQTKELDVMINIVKTKERSKKLIFSEPFFNTQNVIYVNKNNYSFDSLKDLEYQTIAIAKGFFTQEYLKKHYPKIKQILVKDQLEALKLLSLGKVDAAIGKKTVMDYLIAKNSIPMIMATKYIEDDRLRSALRLGVSKDDKILIGILNKVQKQVGQKEFMNLTNKWFGVDTALTKDITKEQAEYISAKKEIRVCTNNTWTPIEFSNKEGIPIGISIDTLKLIERKLDTTFRFVKTNSWKEAQTFLKERKCDILPSAVKTQERLEYADFTKAYLKYDLAIITKKDKPLVAGINSIIDKTMSRNNGSGLISKLNVHYPDLNIVKTKSYLESLEKVENGDVYFTLSTLPVYNYYKNMYKLDNLQISGYSDIRYDIRMAVRNDDKMLLSVLNTVLESITEDTHTLIYEKWINRGNINNIDYDLIWKILTLFTLVFSIVIFFMLRQNRLKQTIEKQKRTFENLYEKSSDGILLVEKGRIIDCNEAVLKLLGYRFKREIVELHPFNLYPKYQPDGSDSYKKAKTMILKAIKEGSNSFEWVYKKSNDEELWTEVVLTKIELENKDIIHVVLRDIEQRKKAQNQLSQLNRTLKEKVRIEVNKNREKDKQMLAQSRLAQMGELLSMIAHQWKQPLSSINNTAMNMKFKLELGSYDLNTKEEREKFEKVFVGELEDIENYVGSLTATIDDFKNFYKPNRSKTKEIVTSPIKNAYNIIKIPLEVDGIKVYEEYGSTTKIDMYDRELMQVFLNILQNSQDAFKEIENKEKFIKIVTKDTLERVNITISDNAGGIPKKILPNIFDPYFSTKTQKHGTGLGLYMSKIIIEEHHNGKISGYNTGEGISFEIIIDRENKQ